jgi:hypothetical protein
LKSEDLPHAKRRGWLKNGNQVGDFSRAPRCGAHARRTSQPCKSPSMANGRCRLHGGRSTGPRTLEGKARAQKANWRHGEHSKEMRTFRAMARQLGRSRKKPSGI